MRQKNPYAIPRPPFRVRLRESFLFGSFVAFLGWCFLALGVLGCLSIFGELQRLRDGPREFIEGFGLVHLEREVYGMVRSQGGELVSAVGWPHMDGEFAIVRRLAWNESVLALGHGRGWLWIDRSSGRVTGRHDGLPPPLEIRDVQSARDVFNKTVPTRILR